LCVCASETEKVCVRECVNRKDRRLGDMGWLRLVGSTKLQVSFAEYRLFYRALLCKRDL